MFERISLIISKKGDNSRSYILIIIVLVTFLSFLNKGKHDLQEWDESRYGVNAYEMLQNKDYINFYYNNKLDTWNGKPPLMIWLITVSYKIFGFNEFALRFPSTLSTVLFFILCFYTITLLESNLVALLTCFILISSKGILGNHIGLTGDFDVLLLVFLTASVYTFILYAEKQKKFAIYFTAIFIGLAFYTKGPASFVLIPGFIIYLLLRKKIKELFNDKHVWFSILILLGIISTWFLLVYFYGKTTTNSFYGSKNSIETMLFHDTFRRLTSSDFESNGIPNRSFFFFFQVLDSRLNLWNYVFYLTLISGIVFSFKNKHYNFLQDHSNRLAMLSFCIIIPLSLVLTLSVNQHNWYLAPTFMFVAFLTAKGMLFSSKRWKPLLAISTCLLTFTLGRQFYYIYSLKNTMHNAFTKNELLENKNLVVTCPINQDLLLYLKWLNVTIIREENASVALKQKGELILMLKTQTSNEFLQKVVSLQEMDKYTLGIVKN